jgi:hypothetical protein
MPGTLQILGLGTSHVPLEYQVAGGQVLDLIAVNADFDGAAAGVNFEPVVEIVSDAGEVMARGVGPTITAGSSASVTFAPFLRSAGSSSGGGIDFNKINDHAADGTIANYLDVRVDGGASNGGLDFQNTGDGGIALIDDGLGGVLIREKSGTGGIAVRDDGTGGIGIISRGNPGNISVTCQHGNIDLDTRPGNADITLNTGTGNVLTALPVADPGVSGALWNNAGVVNVSP